MLSFTAVVVMNDAELHSGSGDHDAELHSCSGDERCRASQW